MCARMRTNVCVCECSRVPIVYAYILMHAFLNIKNLGHSSFSFD